MPIRSRRIARCSRCGLPSEGRFPCLCADPSALRQPIALRTRILLIAHHTEWRRSSNTGRLIAASVAGTRVVLRGKPEPRAADDGETPAPRRLVLFPEDGARDLEPDDASDDVTLVVPEGSWGQARRAVRREPWCRDAPRVKLPPDVGPSRYRLRRAPHAGELATYEAVVRALEILEGADKVAPLWEIFERFVERSLAVRGRRSDVFTALDQAAVDPRR